MSLLQGKSSMRNSLVCFKLYDFHRASRYGTSARIMHDFVHCFRSKVHGRFRKGFSCGISKIRRFQQKRSSQIKNNGFLVRIVRFTGERDYLCKFRAHQNVDHKILLWKSCVQNRSQRGVFREKHVLKVKFSLKTPQVNNR